MFILAAFKTNATTLETSNLRCRRFRYHRMVSEPRCRRSAICAVVSPSASNCRISFSRPVSVIPGYREAVGGLPKDSEISWSTSWY